MPTFYSEAKLRERGNQSLKNRSLGTEKVAAEIRENIKRQPAPTRYDAFLSYSSLDWTVVYGLYLDLLEKGMTVYVDRVEDPHLDRQNVTSDTARVLRERMKQCKTLLFATTNNVSQSKWLPWEVGFHDGFSGKVAIIPITISDHFSGQEYLGIYPMMESDGWLRTSRGDLMEKVGLWIKR